MERSYPQLPAEYETVFEVDLKNNKKEYNLINIGSLVLAIPFVVLYFFMERSIGIKDGSRFSIILTMSMVAMILVVTMHELIHGLFFKMFGRGKLKFGFHGFAVSCAMPTHYFSKKSYVAIGLAPLIILSIVTGISSILLYNTDFFLIAYIPLAINFSGSIGDIYVVMRLSKCKNTALVNDQGVSMKVFDRAS